MRGRRFLPGLACVALLLAPAAARAVVVDSEAELRAAWTDPRETQIELGADIFLQACKFGEPIRESPWPISVDGNGHTLQQTCFEKRLLRQDGTGFVLLENIALTRGGNDGPGAAITTRGEIEIRDSHITENLAEEPGGGVFSMRRATVVRSVITGNLANDDGGGVYARRGGVEVFDSIISANLVDGSGGAIGSTGDILVVNSHVDGNTTDGDGGALYTDEDGDVTVINSTVDGNTADGPGGAIFTLEGDVTIVNSTVNGNRADDRGGAISGEADVSIIGSTIARNASIAHVGGGVWSRDDLYVTNSTIARNNAEGVGGGLFAAGELGLVNSTVLDNASPVAGSLASGDGLMAFGSIIGPTNTGTLGGQVPPTEINCRVGAVASAGFNFTSDHSCGLDGLTDVEDAPDLKLAALADNGGAGETRMPDPTSLAVDAIPLDSCHPTPFGYSFEGEQHLAAFEIDPLALVVADQRGAVRPDGAGCDAGAVEQGIAPSAPPGPTTLDVPEVADLPQGIVEQAASDAEAEPGNDGPAPAAWNPRARGRLGDLQRRADRIGRRLRPMERSGDRFRHWLGCIKPLRVSEYGDPDHSFGFDYDELNGGPLDHRPALARDPTGGRPDLLFLNLSRRVGCESTTTVPGGTADNPRPVARARRARLGSAITLDDLERRIERLEERADKVEQWTERFDEYESCLSWIPVTEYGDPEERYGYAFGPLEGETGYRPALAIDISEWDDPDYEFLGFIGRDRPFVRRECGHEPGEGVDRVVPRPPVLPRDNRNDRREDVAQDLGSLAEDVEDLFEPAEEFEQFDQCMFTVGVSSYGKDGGDEGFVFGAGRRAALAMDMRGFDPPQFDLLAFPGEEPPQIECNEDAGGQNTDE
jgi:predicted outer membrane repeat protein